MKIRGYSLIELMVTISILAFLAAAAAPMGSNWIKESNLEETEGQIMQALGRAKSSGLRNPAAKTSDQIVALVCIDVTADNLWIMESTTSVDASCATDNTATKLWQTTIHDDVTVTDTSNNTVSCLCTNNKGILVNTGSCSGCFTGDQLKLSAGSSHRYFPIF